jgi:hypothetical protein
MSTGLPRSLVAMLAALLTGACASSSEPTAPVSNAPSFSVAIKGDVSSSLTGLPLSLKDPTGYAESANGAPLQSTSVVIVSFTASDAGKTSVTIGLMGPIQAATYNIRVIGSSPLGSKPELYGSISQTDFDGRHNFTATSGTVTLTSVGTTLHGTFALHYGRVTLFPVTPTPGTSYPATPANVDATGSFVVAAPTLTIP